MVSPEFLQVLTAAILGAATSITGWTVLQIIELKVNVAEHGQRLAALEEDEFRGVD